MSAPLLVRAADRPGALERLLGLVRRRAMQLRAEGMGRHEAGGTWVVVLVPTASDAPVERYAHDIRALVDIEDVQVVPPEAVRALVRTDGTAVPRSGEAAREHSKQGRGPR